MLLRFIMILLGVNSFNINSFFRFFFKNFSTSSPIFQIEIAKFRKLFFFIEKSLFIFLNHLNKFLFADIVNISPFFNHTFANASFWLLIFSSLLMSILNKKIVGWPAFFRCRKSLHHKFSNVFILETGIEQQKLLFLSF